MMGFAVIVGAAVANFSAIAESWTRLVWGFVTGFALTAASMVLNDYYDRKIDLVNDPTRPIPSGTIKPEQALIFGFLLTLTGFVAAWFTSLLCFSIAIAAWVVSASYTTVGKRSGLPGNVLVSLIVAIPLIYGSVALTNTVGLNVLIFVLMVFLSITGREVTKGIVDIQGDRSQNVKTIAVRHGERVAARVAVVFYLSAVLLTPIPWFLNLVSLPFIPLVAITNAGLVASAIMLLKDYSRENARRIKNLVLLWSIFGLSAFIAGTFQI
jgi:geranylgeranylglycerol-phosphate geranylgeranyltransferase